MHETNEFCDSSPTHSLRIDPIPEVEDTHLSSSEEVIDLSKFNEDIIQDNSTRLDILPLNDTFEISNDSFLPGFSLYTPSSESGITQVAVGGFGITCGRY